MECPKTYQEAEDNEVLPAAENPKAKPKAQPKAKPKAKPKPMPVTQNAKAKATASPDAPASKKLKLKLGKDAADADGAKMIQPSLSFSTAVFGPAVP